MKLLINVSEDLFEMTELFLSTNVYAITIWFLAFYCGTYFAKFGGSPDFLSSVSLSVAIYGYIQLFLAAKHSLDIFTPLGLDKTLFPQIVHQLWKLSTVQNEGVKMNRIKWSCGTFCHSQSSQVPQAILGWKCP